MYTRILAVFGAGTLALMAAPLSAHHGWGGQSGEQSQLSGTVTTGVSLAGPHATMQIEDAEGQVWDITLAPSSRTSRAGLTEEMIPVGAEVTVTGNRNSDMSRYEMKTVRVTHEGTNYDVYPRRID